MSKKHEATCVGLFQEGKVYFKKPPCETCKKAFEDIIVIGSPPNPTIVAR